MTPLLDQLREERGRHGLSGGSHNWCDCLNQYWPCPTARALDVAIAGVEKHQPDDPPDEAWCKECCADDKGFAVSVDWPCPTYRAMLAAYEGNKEEER